jgi:hypothetical protein
MDMKTQIITAILSLALLMAVSPASAQKTYLVSVSRHSSLPALTESDVKGILADASKMLQNVSCDVTFTLKGPVGTFGSPDTPASVDEAHIDAVHLVDANVVGVDFHVKVVKKITNFCRIRADSGFHGCAFPPQFRSIIVEHPETHTNPAAPSGPPLRKGILRDHLLWAHEFGHLTGLGHRIEPGVTGSAGQPHALMTPCDLTRFSRVSDASVQVRADECRCLLGGPGSCPLPEPVGCPMP